MRNDVMSGKTENIELTLPVNAAYVSAARLTASSISNRMGFNIEDIEDIKAAVSEACVFLIKECTGAGKDKFQISFCLHDEMLEITLSASSMKLVSETPDEDGLGIKMIQAMMDNLTITAVDNTAVIKMTKKKK